MRICSSLVAVTMCFGLAAGAGAQSLPGASGPSLTGIPLGPFLFNPSLDVGWEWKDNLLYGLSGPARSGGILRANAGLALVLPISDSTIELDYRPSYQNYQDYTLSRNWSQDLGVRGSFVFPVGLTLKVGYNYLDASTNVRQVDAGGEIAWSDDPFTKNSASAEVAYWLTYRDGVSVRGSWNDLAYVHPEQSAFYDYSNSGLGIGWLHQLSPNTVLRVGYDHGTFDPKQTFRARGYASDTVSAAVTGALGSGLTSDLEVGWRKIKSDLLPGEPTFDNGSGLVVSGGLGYEMAHGGRLRLTAGRDWNASNYATALGYRSDRIGLDYSLGLVRTEFTVGGEVGRNEYASFAGDPSANRSDDLVTMHAGMAYAFREGLRGRLEYRYQDRSSNDGYNYTVNSVLASIGLSLGAGR